MTAPNTDPIDLAPDSDEYRARLDSLFRYAQVGHCVNGVAHDINNLLGAASAYAELVSLDKHLGSEPKRMLGEVVNSAQRCSKLVSALTGIARKDTLHPGIAEPTNILGTLELLLGYTVRAAKVRFEVHRDTVLPSMWCDSPKLIHALTYLVYNAVEAVRDAEKPAVHVAASLSDGHVIFRVKDTGPEIDADVQARMFDDGFTTKTTGDHFGLGLGRARHIAELHGGTLVYAPDTGFTLTVLPGHLAGS